jgi:hypothetical protein
VPDADFALLGGAFFALAFPFDAVPDAFAAADEEAEVDEREVFSELPLLAVEPLEVPLADFLEEVPLLLGAAFDRVPVFSVALVFAVDVFRFSFVVAIFAFLQEETLPIIIALAEFYRIQRPKEKDPKVYEQFALR